MKNQKLTLSQKASDKVAKIIGSWTFVLMQVTFCSMWVILNTIPYVFHFDPFPYSTLANLLQIEGALAASFILIASNRQAERDSENIEEDLEIAEHMKAEMDTVITEVIHIRGEMNELSSQEEISSEDK
jgi:uncharacterized membrane protein